MKFFLLAFSNFGAVYPNKTKYQTIIQEFPAIPKKVAHLEQKKP